MLHLGFFVPTPSLQRPIFSYQKSKKSAQHALFAPCCDVHTGWKVSSSGEVPPIVTPSAAFNSYSTLNDKKFRMLLALSALRRRIPVGKFRLLQIHDIWSVLILIDKLVDRNVHVFFAYNVHPFKHPFCNQLCSRFTTAYPYRIATSLFYHTWDVKETPYRIFPHRSVENT